MPFGERERELLHRRRARLADVVAADRDRVPVRDPLGAVREQVRRQPHRGPRREDVVPARDVLLEDVVLDGAAERSRRHALLLGDELVEEEQERRRRVDRHRGRDLVERDSGQQDLHVGDGVDRHARAADLAEGARVVGVVAELGRQVERDREAGLAAIEEVAVARVRLLRGGEAGVLPDRPRPPAVHVRVRPASERVFARRLELTLRVGGRVDGLHVDARLGAPVAALRHGVDRRRLRGGVAPRAHRPHAMCDRHARRPRRGGQRREMVGECPESRSGSAHGRFRGRAASRPLRRPHADGDRSSRGRRTRAAGGSSCELLCVR